MKGIEKILGEPKLLTAQSRLVDGDIRTFRILAFLASSQSARLKADRVKSLKELEAETLCLRRTSSGMASEKMTAMADPTGNFKCRRIITKMWNTRAQRGHVRTIRFLTNLDARCHPAKIVTRRNLEDPITAKLMAM